MGTVTLASPEQTRAMSEALPRLRVENVGLIYRDGRGGAVAALENVSIDVAEKEFAVIVGPSGCGKSSLLYLAAGLADATSGRILLNGRPIDGPGADRGMVFQSYTLFPWLTVRRNVEFGLRRRGLPAAERDARVAHFLKEVRLTQFAEAYPKQLSGGMMQRVAIARALANDPQILLMDEPFGALDSQTRGSMQKLLLRVWEHEHKTVLFVTHDVDEAILLGDRLYVMTPRPGRIRQIIPVPIQRPRNMSMVMDPEFIAVKRQVLALLHDQEDDHD
jgi:NitT/TauT family transport system ATP-binding protein